MIDLYLQLREWLAKHGHTAMPPECVMAARDAITSGEALDVHLVRRGLTNPKHYDKKALQDATEAIGDL